MTRCIYCGAKVDKARLHKLDGRIFELSWWCGRCSGKSFDSGKERRYVRGTDFIRAIRVPDGCLFVAASNKL